MSDGVLELIQGECRQVQRLAIVMSLVRDQEVKGIKAAPVYDHEVPGHEERFERPLSVVEWECATTGDRPPNFRPVLPFLL